MRLSFFQRMKQWIRRWWYNYSLSNPVSETPLPKPEVPMVPDVINEYVVIVYEGQKINLHKSKLAQFNAFNRKRKREIKREWAIDERKGKIKFVEHEGKMICVKNRNYDERLERKKQRELNHE